MSTPTITPPPVPPTMAPPPPPLLPRRRSLAGPVVLITIGVIFLLGNMGLLDKYTLFAGFAKYWPLLLILWGVIKLFEGWQAQRDGYRASGISAGGVVLIIFVIILGSVATGVMRYGPELQGNIDVDNSDFPILFGQKFTYTDNNVATLPTGGSFRVVDERGDIKVTVSNDDQVHVVSTYIVIARNDADAQKIHTARVPVFSNEGSILVLNSVGTHGVETADHARVNMEIQLPRKAAAELQTTRGSVRVIGRDGNVKLSTTRGDAQVEDINGSAEVHMRHGDFTAHKVSGDLSLEGSGDEVNVSDIGGQAQVLGEFSGSISVARVPKPVRFRSQRTDLEIGKLDGDMTMELGEVRITSMSGPVSMHSRNKDVRFDDLTGALSIDDSNAQIDVHVSKLPVGAIDISNRNGLIRISLPEKAGFVMDAETRNGEIRSDFPEVKVENSHDVSRGTGKVGNGAANIHLRTEHNDIEIRRSTTP